MMTPTDNSFRSVPEVLLMLRAPGAGKLAELLVALDEASRDPDFSARHRAILARCIDEQSVPAAVAEAARRRRAECNHVRAASIDHRHAVCRVAC
ncbi:MAG TPA: hypothetical protein VF292_10780 [Rhodanobacteraceae bacterium]